MIHSVINYTVEMLGTGAVHSGSGRGVRGLDRGIQRCAGRPYIPGSQLRGLARMNALMLVRRLREAGGLPGEAGGAEEIVGKVFNSGFEAALTVFRDLYAEDAREEASISSRQRVSIDRRRGVQAEQRLFDMEVWYVRRLRGSVEHWSEDLAAGRRAVALLAGGLRLVDAIGSGRSVGLGRCQVRVKRISIGEEELLLADALAPLLGEA